MEKGEKSLAQSKLGHLGIEPDFYTVGYERLNIRELFLLLKENGVHFLVDVREEPWSAVYDFRKAAMEEKLPELSREYGYEVRYVSIPAVGNPFRTHDASTEEILKEYRRYILTRTEELEGLYELIKRYKTALMCYEADPRDCHRSVLSSVLAEKYKLSYTDLRQQRLT